MSFLARRLTKWDEGCDTRVHERMAYVYSVVSFRVYAWNDFSRRDLDLVLIVYSDADFVGCAGTQTSTTGAVVLLSRGGYSAPISCLSKRQGCVSRSIPEAELVATDTAIRVMTLPLLSIVEEVCGSRVPMLVGRPSYAGSDDDG